MIVRDKSLVVASGLRCTCSHTYMCMLGGASGAGAAFVLWLMLLFIEELIYCYISAMNGRIELAKKLVSLNDIPDRGFFSLNPTVQNPSFKETFYH